MFGKSLGLAAAAIAAGLIALAPAPSFAGGSMPAVGIPGYGFGGSMPAVGVPGYGFGGSMPAVGVPGYGFGGSMPAVGVPGYGFGGSMPAVGVPGYGFGGSMPAVGTPFFSFGGSMPAVGMPFNLHTLGLPDMPAMAPGGAMVVWIPAVVGGPAAMPAAPPAGTPGAAQPVLCALDPSNPAAGVPAGQKVVVIADTEMACHAINGAIVNPAGTAAP